MVPSRSWSPLFSQRRRGCAQRRRRHADGHVGSPPSIAAGAPQGSSATAHRSAQVLYGYLESDKFILVRSEGATSRGRGGTKAELTQRAKVGYRPCCTIATHVAILASYGLGEFADGKKR